MNGIGDCEWDEGYGEKNVERRQKSVIGSARFMHWVMLTETVVHCSRMSITAGPQSLAFLSTR